MFGKALIYAGIFIWSFLKEEEDKVIGSMESRQEESAIKKCERETTKHGQHVGCYYKKEALDFDTGMCWEQKVLWMCICMCIGKTGR